MTGFASHLLDGEWIGGAGDPRMVANFDPATGQVVARFHDGGEAEALAAIAAAKSAFFRSPWAHIPRRRGEVLHAFADRLEARAGEIAAWLTRVNGKLLRESAGEIAASVSELRYYAGLSRNLFGRVAEIDEGQFSALYREPAGVAGIIVPWNAPVTLLIRSLAPAMAAGCTCVIKPAHQTAIVTQLVLECLAEVPGLPKGVVNAFYEAGHAGGEALVTSPDVDVVSFTGSPATAKRIMVAGASTLKRLSLELGGKAPCLVFEDADIPAAAAGITAAATVMAGQMCTAATRVIAHAPIAAALREELKQRFEALVVGPGNDPRSQMGPVIDRANRDRIARLAEAAAAQGEVIVPGGIPDGAPEAGAFVRPALIAVEDMASPYVQDELFGPILNFEVAPDEAAAIARANATRYGLAASIWTRDLSRATRVARALRSGTVWINCHNRLFAEAETGGFRESGTGRLHGLEGLNDFLETKHVYHEAPALI